MLDSDGQHDPQRLPAFIEASRRADVVIGNRHERGSMPLARGSPTARRASRSSAPRAWVPDTQNGMRLFRTAALRDVALPGAGTRPRAATCGRCSPRAAQWRRSTSRRSTKASRATIGRSPTLPGGSRPDCVARHGRLSRHRGRSARRASRVDAAARRPDDRGDRTRPGAARLPAAGQLARACDQRPRRRS